MKKKKSTSNDHDEEEEEQKTKEKREYSGRLRDAALLEGVCVPPPENTCSHTHTHTHPLTCCCQDTHAASV